MRTETLTSFIFVLKVLLLIRHGKAKRSGKDDTEKRVYYTHRSQERNYVFHEGEPHKESLRWGTRKSGGGRWGVGRGGVFIVFYEATCKAG